jgi:hypothetical protein
MEFLIVQITRFADEHQPGWVACEFEDAEGVRHTFVEKVPVITNLDLDATSKYPQPGMLPCRVLARWETSVGAERIRISLKPLDVTTLEGVSEFVVLPTQISEVHPKLDH